MDRQVVPRAPVEAFETRGAGTRCFHTPSIVGSETPESRLWGNRVRKIVPWLVSALLSLLAAEAFGVAVFYFQNGSLVYRNVHRVEEAKVASNDENKLRMHPYFGYTGKYSLNGPVFTNSLGFGQQQHQPQALPFKPGPNDFVVAVFGASVAGNMITPTNQGLTIEAALKELPVLKDKNVVLFGMTLGPQKQPQQVMELAFLFALGQHIDLVLDVSGTVEFASSLANFEAGVHPIFPPVNILGALGRELAPVDAGSLEFYELAFNLSRDRAAVKRYTKLLAESSSGLEFLKNRFAQAYYARGLAKRLGNYEHAVSRGEDWERAKRLFSLDMAIPLTSDQVADQTFQTWLRCLDLMKAIANANGAAFMEVIHPNPYHSKKKLTQPELAVLAVPETDAFRRGSAAGYRLMERQADELTSRGIVYAADLFDNVGETIYTDSVGHFSKLGETMLARHVASQVAARLAERLSQREAKGQVR